MKITLALETLHTQMLNPIITVFFLGSYSIGMSRFYKYRIAPHRPVDRGSILIMTKSSTRWISCRPVGTWYNMYWWKQLSVNFCRGFNILPVQLYRLGEGHSSGSWFKTKKLKSERKTDFHSLGLALNGPLKRAWSDVIGEVKISNNNKIYQIFSKLFSSEYLFWLYVASKEWKNTPPFPTLFLYPKFQCSIELKR